MLIVLTAFSLAILMFLSVSTQTVLAQDASYDIQSVDHQVEVMYSGHVVIRDTIHVSGLSGDFLIGFPYKYGSYVLKGIAYDTDNVFQVSLGVQLLCENKLSTGRATSFYRCLYSFKQSSQPKCNRRRVQPGLSSLP